MLNCKVSLIWVVKSWTVNLWTVMFFTYVVNLNRCQSLRYEYFARIRYSSYKKAGVKVLFWKIWAEPSAVHWKPLVRIFPFWPEAVLWIRIRLNPNLALLDPDTVHVYIQPHYNTCFMLPLFKRMLHPGPNDANLSSKECQTEEC
jgi:hypothetical protein